MVARPYCSAAPQIRRFSRRDSRRGAPLCSSSALIYGRLRWACARGDLVLRFGREIAGVMSFVQLFFKRPADAVDHLPALDGRARADFFRPARQVFIFVRLQELEEQL